MLYVNTIVIIQRVTHDRNTKVSFAYHKPLAQNAQITRGAADAEKTLGANRFPKADRQKTTWLQYKVHCGNVVIDELLLYYVTKTVGMLQRDFHNVQMNAFENDDGKTI